jgi:hypothetical protein
MPASRNWGFFSATVQRIENFLAACRNSDVRVAFKHLLVDACNLLML